MSVLRAGEELRGELESFGLALRDADIARLALDKVRLGVDRERVQMERTDSAKEHELRREEGMEQHELELEKFKMMMGAFMQA